MNPQNIFLLFSFFRFIGGVDDLLACLCKCDAFDLLFFSKNFLLWLRVWYIREKYHIKDFALFERFRLE